jgi:hypothetical protein
MKRLAESAGDIRDGRGDASHRQLLKDIENANVLTGGRVFRSQWDIYRKAWTLAPCRHWQAVNRARQAYDSERERR